VLADKAAVRDEVWSALRTAKAARFPGTEGRIPNFVGAERAAERLRDTDEWHAAATVKANPDSPQLPVRQRALEDGKTVFMAVPRLATDQPFLLLDPSSLTVPPRRAASITGASRHGRPIRIDDLEPVDLVVVGCVAVSPDGSRLGKGGGFSDLEYALACEAGLIGSATIVATTLHEVQVVDDGRIPVTAHDFRLDMIVTPERVLRCRRADRDRRPTAIRWEELTDDKITSIPVLETMRRDRTRQ